MHRFDLKTAICGITLSSLVAAVPVSAEITYYWETGFVGGAPAGVVTNDLSIVTTDGGFTAVLLAELSSGTFYNPSSSDVPVGGPAGDSYFGGGFNAANTGSTPSPVFAGKAVDLGGSGLGGGPDTAGVFTSTLINQTWLPDLDALGAGNFPTGTVLAPAFGGRFSTNAGATGTYSIRLANEAGDIVSILNGTITNGRFSQILAGDANMSGTVNAQDANIWRANFGSGSLWVEADWNGDDVVNAQDANIWRQNFGASTRSGDTQSGNTRVGGDNLADFTYDRDTGELSVTTDGEVGVWSINVETATDPLSTDTPPNWAFSDFGDNIEWTDQTLGVLPLGEDETFVLGNLGAGMSAGDFGRVLYFVNTNFDEQFGTVNVVPEPGSLALLGLGGLALLRRRR